MAIPFDTTVDLLAFHLATAGVPEDRHEEALEAVRQAIKAMPGANIVDLAYAGHLVPDHGLLRERWVTFYKPGSGKPQTGPEWTTLKLDLAEVIDEALRDIA